MDRVVPKTADASYRKKLKELQDKADCVVVVWTPASVESVWVHSEADRALINKKLVQVVIGAARRNLPQPFDAFFYIDLTNWSNNPTADGLSILIDAIKHLLDNGEVTGKPEADKSKAPFSLLAPEMRKRFFPGQALY